VNIISDFTGLKKYRVGRPPTYSRHIIIYMIVVFCYELNTGMFLH